MMGAAQADAPSHFLLFSPFPEAHNLMGAGVVEWVVVVVEGIVLSQQSVFGLSIPPPNHIAEIGGLLQAHDFPFLWRCVTPDPGHPSPFPRMLRGSLGSLT